MLLISSLAFTLFSWQALAATKEAVAASTPADTDGDCISAHHLLSLSQTLSWLHLNASSTELAVELPVIPDKYIVSPTACVPSSLSRLFIDPVVQVAKDRQLLSKMDELLAVTPVTPATRTPRGVTTGRLEKRIREFPDCKKMKHDTKVKASSFSCRSAKNEKACDTCTNLATVHFVFSCASCLAKGNLESPYCCAAAATAFLSFYSHICLDS